MTDFPIITHKYGTAAQWTAANTVLELSEIGVEYDTHKMKVGDGLTAWNSLPYIGAVATVTPAQQRINSEIFNAQTSNTSGNDRTPYSGKIYVVDPTIAGSNGVNIDGAAAGDIWLW